MFAALEKEMTGSVNVELQVLRISPTTNRIYIKLK
jgi:hypothetical protein